MKRILTILLSAVLFFSSCRKYLEVGAPPIQLIAATVFENDATATAALLGVYSGLENESVLYHLALYTALSADEATAQSSSALILDFASNSLTSENSNVQSLWSRLYQLIYQCNALLDGLAMSHGLTPSVQQQLEGEAKFLRGFCYFYLTNLYGKVPLVLTSDYEVSSLTGASSVDSVYAQIKADLLAAKSMLGEAYLDGHNKAGAERLRVNRWAASALLARMYLFTHDYTSAETEALSLTSTPKYKLVSNPDSVFLKNSAEAIWQVQALGPRYSTNNGNFFILTTRPSVSSLSTDLYNAMDSSDRRKSCWVKSIKTGGQTYYYPYKYKLNGTVDSPTEYTMILRLAEMYLILAEAQVMQNKLTEGAMALNMIRTRAGLSPTTAVTKDELLEAIYKERRLELLYELGLRWLDLKQSRKADEVLSPLKGANWTTDDMLYPIPESEIIRNPLLTQNPGY